MREKNCSCAGERERERDRAQTGKGQRKREREDPIRLHAVNAEPNARLDPRNREIII